MAFSKIIFVCTENTCRSIMAESLFNRIKGVRPMEVISRGLVVLFPEPVNAKAVKVMAAHGTWAEKELSEPLLVKDIDDTALILTMTVREKKKVMETFEQANFIYTIREFIGDTGDIDEPFGELDEYEACYCLLKELITTIIERLFEEKRT